MLRLPTPPHNQKESQQCEFKRKREYMIKEKEEVYNLLFNAQKNLSQGIMPTEEIKGGIFLLISGLLLITPGFFTDCIGFAMFLKPVQNFVTLKAKNYFQSRRRY